MRKFVVPSAWLLLCLLLILFSDACMTAASTALGVWWERVLPALLPFSVFLSLADGSGLFSMLEFICQPIAKRLHLSAALFPAALFGMLSGYPNGARLCSMRGIPLDAAFCSFCSPVFLFGVVAQGLYGAKKVFLPILLAHIGSAWFAFCSDRIFGRHDNSRVKRIPPIKKTTDFFITLRECLSIMASVGGCMVLFSVGIALIEASNLLYPIAVLFSNSIGAEEALLAGLHGLFEFAGGCVSIAKLDLPLQLRLSMTAATVSFGGLCVLMQSAMFLDKSSVRRFAALKLLQGIAAFGIAYFLCPFFLSQQITVSLSRDEILGYTANAMSMGSMLFASSTVVNSFYLFSLALKRKMLQTIQ